MTNKNQRVYQMSFSKVYPLLVQKVIKKGGSKDDVDKLIMWLTGYSILSLVKAIDDNISYETFFNQAPNLNLKRLNIKGKICGIDIQNIEEPLMKEIRFLDKIVDDLSKGKKVKDIINKLQI